MRSMVRGAPPVRRWTGAPLRRLRRHLPRSAGEGKHAVAALTRTERPLPPERLAAVRAPFTAFGEARGCVWTDAAVLQPLSLLLDLAGEAMRARLFTVAGGRRGRAVPAPRLHHPHRRRAHRRGRGRGAADLYEGKAFRTAPARHRPPGGVPADRRRTLRVRARIAPARGRGHRRAWLGRASQAGGRERPWAWCIGDVSLFDAFLSGPRPAPGCRPARGWCAPMPSGQRAQDRTRPRPGVPGRACAPAAAGWRSCSAALPEGEAGGRAAGAVDGSPASSPVGGRSAAEIAHRLCVRAEQASRRAPFSAAEAALVGRYLDIIGPPREALGAGGSPGLRGACRVRHPGPALAAPAEG